MCCRWAASRRAAWACAPGRWARDWPPRPSGAFRHARSRPGGARRPGAARRSASWPGRRETCKGWSTCLAPGRDRERRLAEPQLRWRARRCRSPATWHGPAPAGARLPGLPRQPDQRRRKAGRHRQGRLLHLHRRAPAAAISCPGWPRRACARPTSTTTLKVIPYSLSPGPAPARMAGDLGGDTGDALSMAGCSCPGKIPRWPWIRWPKCCGEEGRGRLQVFGGKHIVPRGRHRACLSR